MFSRGGSSRSRAFASLQQFSHHLLRCSNSCSSGSQTKKHVSFPSITHSITTYTTTTSSSTWTLFSSSSSSSIQPRFVAYYSTTTTTATEQQQQQQQQQNEATAAATATAATTTTTSTTKKIPHVAIVGSGPAGFYTAKYLLKQHPTVRVSILEKFPVPYGLVRFGVAPDHPEVKLVTNDFEAVAQNERCKYFGNVHVGSNHAGVTIEELRKLYDGIVLAFGTSSDKRLNIKGEHLRGVRSAREFVNFYNGLPQHPPLIAGDPNEEPVEEDYATLLKRAKTAVVIGQGNVAIDVARILSRPASELRQYDVTEEALEALSQSQVQRILVVGRRGPIQAACTTKELREILPYLYIDHSELEFDKDEVSAELWNKAERAQKRLVEVMKKAKDIRTNQMRPAAPTSDNEKQIELVFYRSPAEIIGDSEGRVAAIKLEKTKLDKDGKHARGTGEYEEIKCEIVFKSIGYHGVPIHGVPFDATRGIIPNQNGRVIMTNNNNNNNNGQGEEDKDGGALYVCGWIKRGPTGIIGTNLVDAQETVSCILHDFGAAEEQDGTSNGTVAIGGKEGAEGLEKLLKQRGVRPVTFEEYKKIEAAEVEAGKTRGKLREKITSVASMLEIAHGAK